MEVFDDRVAALGEGPFYDDRTGRAGWVDVLGHRILLRNVTSGAKAESLPVSPDRLVAHLADLIVTRADPAGWVRVGLDGPDAAQPERLAEALVAPLRVAGRPSVRVAAADQLRPASLRYERGRTDPDSYYEDWLDEEGLRREVLDPLGPGGTGRIRPVRWDARADRASRSGFEEVEPGSVLLLSGPLLLGRGLSLDLSVHLDLTPAALARRTPEAQAWTLPAFARYTAEVAPATWADVVVRYDDPRHPALARTIPTSA